MPFKSKAQQGFMFAEHPAIAREMADKTTKKQFKALPRKVGKKKVKRNFASNGY